MTDHIEDLTQKISVMRQQEQTVYRCEDYLNLLHEGLSPQHPANIDSLNSGPIKLASQEAQLSGSWFPALESLKSTDLPRVALSESWRRKICEWKYQIVDYYNVDREIVSISMSYLDRYLMSLIPLSGIENRVVIGKKHFQLTAMTCLFIAVKLHEPSYEYVNQDDSPHKRKSSSRYQNPHAFPCVVRKQKLKIGTLVELSRGFFEEQHFEEMERQIFGVLQWHLLPPTSVQFVRQLLEFMPVDNRQSQSENNVKVIIYEIARYLAELGVCVFHISVLHKPSTVAYAAILNAMGPLVYNPNDCRISQYDYQHFVDSVASFTNLRVDNKHVIYVREMLESLCPQRNTSFTSMSFTSYEDLKSAETEQDSPSCVSNFGKGNGRKCEYNGRAHRTSLVREVSVDATHYVTTNSNRSSSPKIQCHSDNEEMVEPISPPSCHRYTQMDIDSNTGGIHNSNTCPWDQDVPPPSKVRSATFDRHHIEEKKHHIGQTIVAVTAHRRRISRSKIHPS